MIFLLRFVLDVCLFRKFTIFGSSIYDNARVCLVTTKSIHSHELLWHFKFPSTIFTMGSTRFLCYPWQHHLVNFNTFNLFLWNDLSMKFNYCILFYIIILYFFNWFDEFFIYRVDLMGMAVGHIYYFLEDVFPKQRGGFRILKTPLFL